MKKPEKLEDTHNPEVLKREAKRIRQEHGIGLPQKIDREWVDGEDGHCHIGIIYENVARLYYDYYNDHNDYFEFDIGDK